MVVVAVKRMLKRSDLLVNVVSSARGLVRTTLKLSNTWLLFYPIRMGRCGRAVPWLSRAPSKYFHCCHL